MFTDIDDTLTTNGLLPAEAFSALWKLHAAGIRVVPVTGRPAGWCDHIARMWPVAGVVGENGALYFAYDRRGKKMRRVYSLGEGERAAGRLKLEKIRQRVLAEVPGAAVASDQSYRIADLAIDFCEDVQPLDRSRIEQICRISREEGATYKVSSIHVNCWYGAFDKISCVKRLVEEQTGRAFTQSRSRVVFFGDSPNDEPIFAEFEYSVGVANIRNFMADIRHLPVYITEAEASAGFAEAVGIILRKRSSQ